MNKLYVWKLSLFIFVYFNISFLPPSMFRRFGRIISLKGHNQMRKYIQRWASLVDRSKLHSESGVEIARLRNQLCNLKATLHDLTNQDEAAASLAAERALNRSDTQN